jgi:hypothetical protein
LVLQSNGFDTTWTNTNSSETAASGTAPDGTNTAWEFKDTADGSAVAHRLDQTVSFTSGVSYTLSIYAKVGSIQGVHFLFPSGAFGVDTRINFDLSLGTASVFAGTATASITNSGNGWYRCVATATASSTASAAIQLRTMKVVSGTLSSFYQGDGTGTILVWGAQLEAGAFPTSYIPTTTAAVTRSADVASISGSNYSSWANNNEGTIFSDSSIIASQIKTQVVWELSGGTVLSSLRQPQGTANRFRAVIGDTFTASPGTGESLTTGVTLAAVAYSGTVGRLQVASVGADATGSALDATSLSIGSLAGSSQLNGRIKRLAFWPRRLGNEVLQGITQ